MGFHALGFFAIIPVSVLLTFSFFVLYAASKTESGNLKKFGKVVAILLWISATVILSAGIGVIVTGGCHQMRGMMRTHCGMMSGKMEGSDKMDGKMSCDMMKNKMPGKDMKCGKQAGAPEASKSSKPAEK